VKIKYQGSYKNSKVRDVLGELFSVYYGEYDEADYCFAIVLFGREWMWYINKGDK
jgi:hypothetical protein